MILTEPKVAVFIARMYIVRWYSANLLRNDKLRRMDNYEQLNITIPAIGHMHVLKHHVRGKRGISTGLIAAD